MFRQMDPYDSCLKPFPLVAPLSQNFILTWVSCYGAYRMKRSEQDEMKGCHSSSSLELPTVHTMYVEFFT